MPIHESLFCSIQKVYSQLSSRRASGIFQNDVDKGNIEHAPHFNAPSNLLKNPNTTPILQKLVELTASPLRELETDFAVDSTGFRTSTSSMYNDAKHGLKKSHIWLKAHLIIGVKTNIIADVRITDENSHDALQFKPLVESVANNFEINEVSADKAYSSRENLDIVNKCGEVAYIPFKKNATDLARGSPLWHKMYHNFQLHREEFDEHYHKRSNIEATNAAIKRKFGETLKSKNKVAQVNELLAKVVAYNITVIIHEVFENGINPGFAFEDKYC